MIYKYKWLIVFLLGLVLLLLPDRGKPVFKLNNSHGPSLLDLAGLSMIFASWVTGIIIIVKNWSPLTKRSGAGVLFSMLLVYILSIIGIIAGLNLSSEWILWISAAVAAFINVSFIISALRIEINKT